MMTRKRSRACASSRAGPCRVSMKPESDASGVRSSWLALATKSARISSTRRSGVRSWKVISTRSRPARPASAPCGPASRCLEPAVDRHALDELDPLRAAARRARGGSPRAPRARATPARPARRARSAGAIDARRGVERHDAPLRSSAITGSGSAGDHRLEQRRADLRRRNRIGGCSARRRRRRPRSRPRPRAGRQGDQRRQQCKHAERPKAGERERRDGQRQRTRLTAPCQSSQRTSTLSLCT